MRNSWLQVSSAGRKTPVTCGPRSLEGSMSGDLFMLDKGKSVLAFNFLVMSDGNEFTLIVRDERGTEILRKVTTK